MNSENKKEYVSPMNDVLDVRIETSLLVASNHETNASRNNYGNATQDTWD